MQKKWDRSQQNDEKLQNLNKIKKKLILIILYNRKNYFFVAIFCATQYEHSFDKEEKFNKLKELLKGISEENKNQMLLKYWIFWCGVTVDGFRMPK